MLDIWRNQPVDAHTPGPDSQTFRYLFVSLRFCHSFVGVVPMAGAATLLRSGTIVWREALIPALRPKKLSSPGLASRPPTAGGAIEVTAISYLPRVSLESIVDTDSHRAGKLESGHRHLPLWTTTTGKVPAIDPERRAIQLPLSILVNRRG